MGAVAVRRQPRLRGCGRGFANFSGFLACGVGSWPIESPSRVGAPHLRWRAIGREERRGHSAGASAGPVEVEDTGGDGPVVVLLHGVLMDHRQWSAVVEQLRTTYRCVLPTLPLGAHRHPMRAGADLSLRGQARLVSEVLERLDLREVTVCFNDWAAPQLMVADGLTDRVAAMVLVSCETAGNYPTRPARSHSCTAGEDPRRLDHGPVRVAAALGPTVADHVRTHGEVRRSGRPRRGMDLPRVVLPIGYGVTSVAT